MAQSIYVSDSSQYEILHNDPVDKKPITLDNKIFSNGKAVVHFNPIRVYDSFKGHEVPKGLLLLDSEKQPELVKYLEEYPDFGKGYNRVDKIPLRTHENGSIITGAGLKAEQSIKEASLKEGVVKGVRFAELRQKLFKVNGDLKADHLDEDLTEFQKLQKELNIQ